MCEIKVKKIDIVTGVAAKGSSPGIVFDEPNDIAAKEKN